MTSPEEIQTFISQRRTHKAIGEMQDDLEKAISYYWQVGDWANQAEEEYEKAHAQKILEIERMDDQTETIRQALMKAYLSPMKRKMLDYKLMQRSLKQIQMTLFQAIKTRSI